MEAAAKDRKKAHTFYPVSDTHKDFGYTDYAGTLYRLHRKIIDRAIEICEENAHLPDPARFRLTCEVSEITLDWLRHASGPQIDRFATEELVQLHAPGGRALLRHRAEGITIALDWNAAHFPDVVLWLSNRGRADFPWAGRHVAIGIEPVAAAFDLGTSISAGENPLNTKGRATAISLEPGIPFETWYRIAVLE